MILFRYLSREILVTMTAVTAVIMMIIMSGRFIKYLASAAEGKFAAAILFKVMAYRIPGFIELILPLGLFLGILLAYGRLYLDSEITVLNACGISEKKLLSYALMPALLVASMVAALSLWVTPQGALAVERIFQEQKSKTEFDTLVPGRFLYLGNNRVIYIEQLTEDRKLVREVFMYQQRPGQPESVMSAESGSVYIDQPSGDRYLVMANGRRLDGSPGQADYRDLEFGSYSLKLPEPPVLERITKRETMATTALLTSAEPADQAQLQWRISLPVLAIVVTLLAVPLSRVNPRQGRFARLIPSILIYLVYLTLLTHARSSIEKGTLPAEFGLWLVHGVFLLLALNLIYAGGFWRRLLWRLTGLLPRRRSKA